MFLYCEQGYQPIVILRAVANHHARLVEAAFQVKPIEAD
jgi:hypothetical protein